MRASYKIILTVLPLAAASVVVSWFLARDGFWFYWIFEVLGFSMLLVFGMMGLLLSMFYQSESAGRALPGASPRIDTPSVELETMSREELEGYWRSAGRFGAVLFVSAGSFVGLLDGWWIYEVFLQPGQGISPSLGAAIAIVLGACVVALVWGGISAFTHRPVRLEITSDGLRIQHARAPDLVIRWSDKRLWLVIQDQREFYTKSPQKPPWNLTIGRWNSYGVSTPFAQSLLAKLRVSRPDVRESAVLLGKGRSLTRYLVTP